MSLNLADLLLDLLADLPPPRTDILLVKISSNLVDLPLDLLADLPPRNCHLVVKMSSILADLPLDLLADLPPKLTSSGQDEFKFGRSTPRSAGRSTPKTDI